jgi:inorganic pyrophosphatase
MSTCGQRVTGAPGERDYRVDLLLDGKPASFLHDLEPWVDRGAGTVRYVVEIPRGTHHKLEVDAAKGCIVHDVVDGAPRRVADPYPFHYGMLPRTLESADADDPWTGVRGDGDPLDVVDLGRAAHSTGDVVTARVLGAVAMMDDGCTDWKLFVSSGAEDGGFDDYAEAFTFLREYKVRSGRRTKPNALVRFMGSKDAVGVLEYTCAEYLRER